MFVMETFALFLQMRKVGKDQIVNTAISSFIKYLLVWYHFCTPDSDLSCKFKHTLAIFLCIVHHVIIKRIVGAKVLKKI